MPIGPQGQKRPRDVVENAVLVGKLSVGEAQEEYVERPRRPTPPPLNDVETADVVFTHALKWEDGRYVATCLELGIAGAGNTADEAWDNSQAAVEVYLDTLWGWGKLNQLFDERGIITRPALDAWMASLTPAVGETEIVRYTVPAA